MREWKICKGSETGDMTDQIFGGRYAVLKLLRQNDGRRTFLARDTTTEDMVVVKLLDLGRENQDELKLFEREAGILEALDHPCIPKYLNYFELDSSLGREFALVQTYIPGKSLQDYLDAGRKFSEKETKKIAKSLLEILVYLHGCTPPVIHRDIKPDNILITIAGNRLDQVYLIDFGAVRMLMNRENTTFTIVGTQGYMPPEQLSGRALAASDLYSTGLTLIVLMTGTHPSMLPKRNLRIQLDQISELDKVNHAFQDWLNWMVEPGIEQRLPSAEAALEALESGKPRKAKPAPPPIMTPSILSRRPAGSKITLHRTPAAIEVVIPPVEFNPIVGGFTTLAVGCNLGALVLTVWALQQRGINWGAIGLSVPLWVIGLGVASLLVYILLRRIRLRLNQQQISLTCEIFNSKFDRPAPTPIKNINKLQHVKPTQGNQAKVLPRIILHSRTPDQKPLKYEIGSNALFDLAKLFHLTNNPRGFGMVTVQELEWIAQELSAWLGMPIVNE